MRRLNQGSFVLLYFVLFAFSGLYLVCVFSCTVLCVGISQVIGCEGRLRNDQGCMMPVMIVCELSDGCVILLQIKALRITNIALIASGLFQARHEVLQALVDRCISCRHARLSLYIICRYQMLLLM